MERLQGDALHNQFDNSVSPDARSVYLFRQWSSKIDTAWMDGDRMSAAITPQRNSRERKDERCRLFNGPYGNPAHIAITKSASEDFNPTGQWSLPITAGRMNARFRRGRRWR
jgi:hypothetical protein